MNEILDGNEREVVYSVSASHGEHAPQEFADAGEAARAFHAIPGNDRPAVIRAEFGPEYGPGGSGQVIASTVGRGEPGQAIQYSRAVSSADPAFEAAYREAERQEAETARVAAALTKQIQTAADRDDGPEERRASIGIEARQIAYANAVVEAGDNVLTPETARTWADLDAREFRKLADPNRIEDAALFMHRNAEANRAYGDALRERAPDIMATMEAANAEQEYRMSLKESAKSMDAAIMAERDADAFDIPQRDRAAPDAVAPEKTPAEALQGIMERNFRDPALDRDGIEAMPASDAGRLARADLEDYAQLDAEGKSAAARVLVENFRNRDYAAEFARHNPDAVQEVIRNADDRRNAAREADADLKQPSPEVARLQDEQAAHIRDTEIGTQMKSIPGAIMVYNDQPGMRGADILMPDGSRVSFGGKEAIDRFAEENKLVAEDVAVLKALDSRADPYRTPAADERLPAGMKVEDLPAIDPAARERMEKARAREMAGVREAMGLDGADAAQPAPAAKQAPRDEVAALDARMEKAQLEELGWRDREDITDLMRDLEKLASKDWQVAADLWQKYRPDDIDKPVFIDGDDIDEKKPGRGAVRDDGRVVDGSKEEDAARNVTPDALRKRFLQAENKFYFRDDENKLAFEDKGKRLATEHNDPEIARSMVDLAQAKGWSSIKLKGTDEFKREVWLQASLKGMDVQGFKPRDVDLARLEDMRKEMGLDTDRASNTIERGAERSKGRDQREERAEPVDRAAVVDEKEQTLSKRQLAALETIKTVMRARGDSEVAVAMAAEMAAERFQTNRVHVGKIIDHGSAPFENDPKKERSYYVKLQTEAGEKIVWGVDLERAVGAGKAQIGDDVALAYQGNKPVTVNVKEHDKAGNVIGVTEKTTNRNTWDVRRLETLREEVKERLTEAARNADRQPLIKVYDRDAQRTQVRPDIVRNEPSKESERARSGRG